MRPTLLFAAPLLGGCFLMDFAAPLAATSGSDWYDVGPVHRPLDEVTRATRDYLIRAGYKIPGFDASARELETDWDTHLSMHWREGFRTKVEVAFVEAAGGANLVHVRSYREVNNTSSQPMNPGKADWMGASLDDKHAQKISEPAVRLVQQLRLKFQGLSQ